MFVTDAAPDFLATTEVADADLSRWPNQEQVFRRARHSVGMERSQGYTGEYVPHSTLDEKLEEAQRQVERTRNEVDSAQMRSLQAQETKKKAKGTELALLASQNVKTTAQQFKHAEAQHEAAVAEEKRLATMPKKIFQRDTTRENIVTATTMRMSRESWNLGARG